MADLDKCSGKGCIIKEKCYRYTAKSGLNQFCIEKPPFLLDKEQKTFTCDLFWGEESEGIINQLKVIVGAKSEE